MSLSASLPELIEATPDPRLACSPRWTRVDLGDVAEVRSGYPFASRYFNDVDGVALVRIRDVAANFTKTRYSGPVPEGFDVVDGDILVGMDGD